MALPKEIFVVSRGRRGAPYFHASTLMYHIIESTQKFETVGVYRLVRKFKARASIETKPHNGPKLHE